MKSWRLLVLISKVFSGSRNSMAFGTAPEKIAVACLPILSRAKVRPMAAVNSSTLGSLLRAIKTLALDLMRSVTCATISLVGLLAVAGCLPSAI